MIQVGLKTITRYSDFQTEHKQSSIDYTASDQVLIVKELFHKLYSRWQLTRLVGVRFTELIAGTYQINLFSDTQEMVKLYQASDSMKKQYGEKYLINAGGYLQKNSRPTVFKFFALKRF